MYFSRRFCISATLYASVSLGFSVSSIVIFCVSWSMDLCVPGFLRLHSCLYVFASLRPCVHAPPLLYGSTFLRLCISASLRLWFLCLSLSLRLCLSGSLHLCVCVFSCLCVFAYLDHCVGASISASVCLRLSISRLLCFIFACLAFLCLSSSGS